VVVTGTGAITPLGDGAARLLDGWTAGDCAVEDGAARCSGFEPAAVLSKRELRRSDRFTQLTLAAVEEAMTQAGWSGGPPFDEERVGCVVGTGIGGIETLEGQYDAVAGQGPGAASPLGLPMLITNAAVAMVAIRHGLRGPNYAVTSACAAGTHAIGAAVRMIQAGDADAAIAGGAEAPFAALVPRATFTRMGALSPSGISRPFDARRDGFVLGEGAGALVLEEAGAAEARGATVLGEVLGYGATADAHHVSAPDPNGRGAIRAMERALEDADVDPDDVDYVNAHGTSTPLNDRVETDALKAVFGAAVRSLPVSSTKSSVGHLLGAAGAIEAVATLGALRERVAPPTLGYEEPDDGLDLDYVPLRPRPLERRGRPDADGRAVAISNSFGFGGHNATLCLAA
jgi:3-oxoacyl-[acyl-carrier-protein] synthase II